MIRINLLASNPGAPAPRVWIPPEQRSAVMGLGMLLCTAAGIGGWWYYQHALGQSIDSRVAAIQTELGRLKIAAKVVDQTLARKSELTGRLALIERLQAAKSGPVTLLQTVSQSVPEGLWLLELKQTGHIIQVEGRALTLTSVTDFAERMQNSRAIRRQSRGDFDRPGRRGTSRARQAGQGKSQSQGARKSGGVGDGKELSRVLVARADVGVRGPVAADGRRGMAGAARAAARRHRRAPDAACKS
jgi:Tfp pilus assembly protein PilN